MSLTFLWLLYREWKRLGGEKHYAPPGFREEAVVVVRSDAGTATR